MRRRETPDLLVICVEQLHVVRGGGIAVECLVHAQGRDEVLVRQAMGMIEEVFAGPENLPSEVLVENDAEETVIEAGRDLLGGEHPEEGEDFWRIGRVASHDRRKEVTNCREFLGDLDVPAIE